MPGLELLMVPLERMLDAAALLNGNLTFDLESDQIEQVLYELPSMGSLGMPLTGLSYDLEETIKSLTINGAAKALAQGTNARAVVTVRLAPAENRSSVCSSGELYGPFNIIINDALEQVSVDPPRATVSQAALGISNSGPYVVCITMESDLKASFSIANLVMSPQLCEEPPQDISGTWSGNFTCSNFGTSSNCQDNGGEISLTITQSENGYSAHYQDDRGATYDGTVCGNVLRYNGGLAGRFTESGVFTMTSSQQANRVADWTSGNDACSGRCRESLLRSE